MSINTAKQIIEQADVVIITAGAGMGVDSGLSDFRGNEGFWKAYPKLGQQRMSFAKLCTQQALEENPELVWALYGHMIDLFNDTIPHTGFASLLELVKSKKDYFVVTSNIDSHFQKAGFDCDKVYEIHGRMNKLQCTDCGDVWDTPANKFNVNPKVMKAVAPKCSCGGLARPNIMMFNDYGFDKTETDEQAKRFNTFMQSYDKGDHKIAILEFGAGEGVPTIRMMSEFIHEKVEGATLVRVNPTDSWVPEDAVAVEQGALKAIKTLV